MICRLVKATAICVVFIVSAACSTTESLGPQTMQGAIEGEPLLDYRLRPGDQIEIKFFYHPELNESQRVGPDGKITLELIDEVLAAGLTTSQLDEVLTKEFSKYLKNISITVIIRAYSGLRIYVGGEVGSPGFVPLAGNMSVLQAIMVANGFRHSGKPESVILIRKGSDNRPVPMVVNLGPVIKGEQVENDIFVRPSDIIYVPKTFIATAGDFVDDYFRRVLFLDSFFSGIGWALGYKWLGD
jgi:protein involved in polysaccharide export with SLBB domain